MPLSPLEAVNRVNEKVTVEMLVKAAKNCFALLAGLSGLGSGPP
jgi:hypothetical protein